MWSVWFIKDNETFCRALELKQECSGLRTCLSEMEKSLKEKDEQLTRFDKEQEKEKMKVIINSAMSKCEVIYTSINPLYFR